VLNRLVWSCFYRYTHYEEQRIRITFRPEADERVLFFATDCAEARKALKLTGDSRMCDVLVFYRGTKCPVLLFTELKSCKLSDAAEQLMATYKAVKAFLPPADVFPKPTFKALIVFGLGSPGDTKPLIKKFAENGVELQVKAGMRGSELDIRRYLV
jgi:hypothetical protein